MPNNTDTSFCFRCYYSWKKRIKSRPTKNCPSCNSPYWYIPRKRISKGIVLKMEEMIIKIHDRIIISTGGELGMRDEGGVYHSTYKLLGHQYKHQKDPESIGAFALNEFAKKHHFIDGNKRTAYAIAKIFMLINKCHLRVSYINNEASKFILEVAKYDTKITFDDIKKWIKENCSYIESKDMQIYLNKTFVELSLGDEKNG